MRILVVTHSLATGGTDRVAVHLANGFAQRFETVLLNVQKPVPEARLLDMIDPSVRRVSLEREKKSRALDLLTSVFDFVSEVRRLKPDLILASGNNNSLFSALGHVANPNRGRRFAVKITNPIIREKDRWFKRAFRSALYRLVLGRCSHILALSQGEALRLTELYPDLSGNIRVVQNPYVTDAMVDLCAKREAATTRRTFLAIGRLHHQKNLSLMLDAWAQANLASARLQIAGEGPLRDQLVAQAEALGIAGSVDFLGYRPNITEYLSGAHCLLLSSDYEGLPAVVLEALAAGCPLISTDCFPSAVEMLGNMPGCKVVPPRDSGSLAAAICESAGSHAGDRAFLQERAAPYRIGNAIESHIGALTG